jgi:hypothetical protein
MNVFILPKKYRSVQDVRLSEVIKALPLTQFDAEHKYMLRINQEVSISSTKRITCWLDIDMDAQNDISCPTVQGKIRIKVLRLPLGIKPKKVQLRPRMQESAVPSESPSTMYMPAEETKA